MKDLELQDIVILFDKNSGVSIFQNFRGYNEPIDDAEWILERNPKTKGFILRPVRYGRKEGLWIGEFAHNGNSIVRQEILCNDRALQISRLMTSYARRRTTEKEVMELLSLNLLKKELDSEIIRGFKYYECPIDQFCYTCVEFKRIYETLKERYKDSKVPYSKVADAILTLAECSEAIVCPLRASNAFDRVYNLTRAVKVRGLGEIRFTSDGTIQMM